MTYCPLTQRKKLSFRFPSDFQRFLSSASRFDQHVCPTARFEISFRGFSLYQLRDKQDDGSMGKRLTI